MYVDESSNAKMSETEILLKNMNGDVLEHSLCFFSQTSNDETEYEALIACLILARKFEAISLKIARDSDFVVN